MQNFGPIHKHQYTVPQIIYSHLKVILYNPPFTCSYIIQDPNVCIQISSATLASDTIMAIIMHTVIMWMHRIICGLEMRFLYEVISKHAFHEIIMHLSITCTPPTTPPPCYTGELTGN